MLKINPKVVDLSHYDDVQDGFAGAVKFGVRGIINKLTEGVGCLDHSAFWRIRPAIDANLHFGVYHFIRPGRVIEQASYFLNNLDELRARVAADTAIKMALDWETTGVSPDDVKQWLTQVHERTGEWAWLYSYSAFLHVNFGHAEIADPFWKQIKLWVASYNDHPTWPTCWDEPLLWQYTGDGSGEPPHNVEGIVIEGKGIDINSYQGTDEQLDAAWNA